MHASNYPMLGALMRFDCSPNNLSRLVPGNAEVSLFLVRYTARDLAGGGLVLGTWDLRLGSLLSKELLAHGATSAFQ